MKSDIGDLGHKFKYYIRFRNCIEKNLASFLKNILFLKLSTPSSISFRISIICFLLNLLFRMNTPDLSYTLKGYLIILGGSVFGKAYNITRLKIYAI